MLNREIEIHDSILAMVSIFQRTAEIHFSSVYIHQTEDEPGREEHTGWAQEATLRIHDVDVKGAFSELPVDLGTGQISIGESVFDNTIPIPLHHKGPFSLRLEAKWQVQEIVTFTGDGADLELLGEPEFIEEIPF